MITRKNIFYFASYESARDHAVTNDMPTDRIIRYELGWAIQLRVSGPYAGPASIRYTEPAKYGL